MRGFPTGRRSVPRQIFPSVIRGGIAVFALACLMAAFTYGADVGPKALFEVAGIRSEQLAVLKNGEPWEASGNEIMHRMLYRIHRDVSPVDLETWSLGESELDRLSEDPEAYQLQVFQLKGRVVLAEPYRLSDRQDGTVEFASIWRCRMLLDNDERPVDVFTAQIPKAWEAGEAIDERSGAEAFFLKTSRLDGDGPEAFFLTDRMAWYPPTYLGRLGMDVGLLDDVPVEAPPKRNPDGTTPEIDWTSRLLTESDHECFYQMLNAVDSAKDGQLSRWAEEELARAKRTSFSVVPLFNEPQTQQGRLVEFKGVARRIIPVRVGESEISDRFGIEEYYQVYLFTDDSQDNPLVFCLRELPEGLPEGDGPGFGEELRVAGFFFKTWSYPTSAEAPDGKPQRQLAPLLIGKGAVWYPVQAPSDLSPMERLVGTALLILVLGVVWFIFRRFSRGDREFERRIRRRKPPEVSEMDWETLDASDNENSKP